MSYVFNSIDASLDGTADNQKSNIFDATQSGGQNNQSSTDAPQSTSSATNPTVASSEGSVPQSGSSANSQSLNQPSSAAKAGNAGQAIVQRNKMDAAPTIQKFQSKAQDTQTKLQDDANSYLDSQKQLASQGSVDQSQIDKALQGDTSSQSAVKGRLTQAAPTVATYTPTINTDLGLGSLQSQGGLQKYLFDQGNERYNKGMASLDASLLGYNPDFVQGKAALQQNQADLNKTASDNIVNLSKQAQDSAAKQVADNQGLIKSYLTQNLDPLRQTAAQKMADYNKQVDALNAQKQSYVQNQIDAARKELINQYSGADPLRASQIKDTIMTDDDAANFYRAPNQVSDVNQFYSPEDAQRFNLIESLLGEGNAVQGSTPLTAQQSFDKAGYQQKILDMAKKLYTPNIPNPSAPQMALPDLSHYIPGLANIASNPANPFNSTENFKNSVSGAASGITGGFR